MEQGSFSNIVKSTDNANFNSEIKISQDEITEVKKIDGTPFTKVITKDRVILVLGKNLIKKWHLTENPENVIREVDEWVNNITWEKITEVMLCLIEIYNNEL